MAARKHQQTTKPGLSVVERHQPDFEANISPTPNSNGCVIWNGFKDKRGYGKYVRRDNGKTVIKYAHRISWEKHNGRPIPAGMMVMHVCPNGLDNPSCVNPEHLTIGTAKENTARMVLLGRNKTPRGKYRKHLSEETVKQIRELANAGDSNYSIARKLDCTDMTVSMVVRGISYRKFYKKPPVTAICESRTNRGSHDLKAA